MAIWRALTSAGVRVYFNVVNSAGNLRTGLTSGVFTVVLVNPGDTANTVLTVTQSTQKPGVYYVNIPSAFITTHGPGHYGLSLGVHATGPKLDAETLHSVEVTQEDVDTVADAVWNVPLEAGFSASRVARITAAGVAGKASGGPSSPTFRNLSDTQNQIQGTATEDGDRPAASYGS